MLAVTTTLREPAPLNVLNCDSPISRLLSILVCEFYKVNEVIKVEPDAKLPVANQIGVAKIRPVPLKEVLKLLKRKKVWSWHLTILNRSGIMFNMAKRKNPHAVALGRKGGLRGGKARAEKLSPERRREIALRAIRSRWTKYRMKTTS